MPNDQPLSILALTETELIRLRKVCLDSDYGDATPIFKRAVARGAEWLESATAGSVARETPKRAAGGKP